MPRRTLVVGTPAASASIPAVIPPSMGPPSVSYIPPITLEEAVIRARVRLRRRAKAAARGLILALALFSLPVLQSVAALFPSDVAAKVPSWAYVYCTLLSAAFVFLCWATYRIMTERPGVSYAVLAVGVAVLLYFGFVLWVLSQVLLGLAANASADLNVLILTSVDPVLGILAGTFTILAGLIAIPRSVPIAESA